MFNKCKSALISMCARINNRIYAVGILAAVSALLIAFANFSVNDVKIVNGGSEISFKSCYSNTDTLLRIANIKYDALDDVKLTKDKNNVFLSVKHAFPVNIKYATQLYTVNLTEGTVADALQKAGITLGQHDVINISPETELTKTENIDIIKVDFITETSTVAIPYTSKTIYSTKLDAGQKQTTSAGKEGIKKITYQKKLVNGTVTESQVISEDIIQQAVTKTVVVGTRKPAVTTSASVNCISGLTPATPIELDANGNPVSYKKHLTVQATAYTARAGKHTATGVVAAPGYIAVNPKVIPYGTKMYIKSSDGRYIYGYAVAADTGGFAKSRPTNVDLFFPTKQQCINFGRRNVEIYILD